MMRNELTSDELYILGRIEANFKRFVGRYSDMTVHRIICAIEAIERYHRNYIWRTVEYLILLSFFLNPRNHSFVIRNLSIGPFQLKIHIILDYLGVHYYVRQKNIHIPNNNTPRYCLLLSLSRNPVVIESMLYSYGIVNDSLSQNSLERFLLDYSRNISFSQNLNYLSVVNSLLNTD